MNSNEFSSSSYSTKSNNDGSKGLDLSIVARAELTRTPVNSLSSKSGHKVLSPSNSNNRPSFHPTSIYTNSIIERSEQTPIGSTPIKDKFGKKSKISYKDFGLQQWREYAGLKFADVEKFNKTPHGKTIIVANALRQYQREQQALIEWADEVETTAKTLEDEMLHEREKRIKAEQRILELESIIRQMHHSPTRTIEIIDPKMIGYVTSNNQNITALSPQDIPKLTRRSSTTNKAPASPWLTKQLSTRDTSFSNNGGNTVNFNEASNLDNMQSTITNTSTLSTDKKRLTFFNNSTNGNSSSSIGGVGGGDDGNTSSSTGKKKSVRKSIWSRIGLSKKKEDNNDGNNNNVSISVDSNNNTPIQSPTTATTTINNNSNNNSNNMNNPPVVTNSSAAVLFGKTSSSNMTTNTSNTSINNNNTMDLSSLPSPPPLVPQILDNNTINTMNTNTNKSDLGKEKAEIAALEARINSVLNYKD